MFWKIFLESVPNFNQGNFVGSVTAGGIMAAFAGIMFFLMGISVLIYVYLSFVYMKLAKKTDAINPAIAWIPVIGPLIVSAKIAKMHWWPILLLVLGFIPFVNFLAMITLTVFYTIWTWKVFEEVGKPGWWAILCLISPLNLIFLGIAAWSKD